MNSICLFSKQEYIAGAMKCPLCLSEKLSQYFDVTEKVFKVPKQRTYQLCGSCSLVFLNPDQRISAELEKARYDVHENFIEDEGYTRFLMQIWEPLKNVISAGASGLDFGCGPTRALASLIEKESFKMETYDPFYKPNFNETTYDFITCTEVLEHVFDLKTVLSKICSLLKPGGHLAVMTELLTEKIDFPSWRYREDDTHICFFGLETLNFIAEHYPLKIKYCDNKRVVLFKKFS